MLSGYFKVIRAENCTQAEIIKKLENKGTLGNKSTLNKDGTTPLAEAIKKNLFDVVKFLIEKKEARIDEKVYIKNAFLLNQSGNQSLNKVPLTALEVALFHRHKEIAEYLLNQIISKKEAFHFVTMNDGFCIALKFAIIYDYLDIFELILSISPELLQYKTTENQNLLLLAVCERAYHITEYLLQTQNSNPRNDMHELDINLASPYTQALLTQDVKLIKLMLTNGANPLMVHSSIPTCTPFMHLLEHSTTISTEVVYLLLACGAGLDKSLIPPKIFTIINKKEQDFGPLVLAATCKGAIQFIDTPKKMELALKIPGYVIETDILTNTLKNPCFDSFAHIHEIRNLPPFREQVNENADLAMQQPTTTISMSAEYFLNQNPAEVFSGINGCLIIFKQHSELWDEEFQKYKNNLDHNLRKSTKQYVDYLRALLLILAHPKAETLDLSKIISAVYPQEKSKDIYAILKKNLREKYQQFVDLIDIKHDINDNLLLLHTGCLKLDYNELLPEKALTLSNFIIDTIIQIGNQVGPALLQNGNFNKAASYAKISLRKNNFDYDDNSSQTAKNDIIQKLYSLFILTTASLGRDDHIQAKYYFNKALRLKYFELDEHMTIILNLLIPYLTQQYSDQNVTMLKALIQFLDTDVLNQVKIEELLSPHKVSLDKFVDIYLDNIKPQLMEMIGERGEIVSLQEGVMECQMNPSAIIALDTHASHALSRFFKWNQDVKCLPADNKIIFTANFMLSVNFKTRFLQLMAILTPPISGIFHSQCNAISTITQDFARLQLQDQKIKVKEKTQGTPGLARQQTHAHQPTPVVENYDFVQLPNHTAPVPIEFKNNIPENTLFITVPFEDKYAPFFSLFKDKTTDNYHPIRGIAPKGKNQQGAKVKSNFVRLKILGSDGQSQLRAWGEVEQEIKLPDGRTKKLYVINEVMTKKMEHRL